MDEGLIPRAPYDLDNNASVAELAIKAMVAPDGIRFSASLVAGLAARLIEARAELQRVRICETADQMAEEAVDDLHLEVLCAAEWAKRHLESQKG